MMCDKVSFDKRWTVKRFTSQMVFSSFIFFYENVFELHYWTRLCCNLYYNSSVIQWKCNDMKSISGSS